MGLNDLNNKLRKQPEPNNSAAAPVSRAGVRDGAEISKQTKPPKRELIRSLQERINSDDLDGVVEVWRECRNATKKHWEQTGTDPKTGKTLGRWVKEPDWKLRMEAAEMLAAYGEGLPIQRQVVIRQEFGGIDATREKIVSSPEMMRALRGMGGKVTHEGEVIDIEVEKVEPPPVDLQ